MMLKMQKRPVLIPQGEREDQQKFARLYSDLEQRVKELEGQLRVTDRLLSETTLEYSRLKFARRYLLTANAELKKKVTHAEQENERLKQKMLEIANQHTARELRNTLREVIDRDGRFLAFANGTVQDVETRLMWSARDNGRDITLDWARGYCEGFMAGGYKDWRIPTASELETLYDPSAGNKRNAATRLIAITNYLIWSQNPQPDGTAAIFLFTVGESCIDSRSFCSFGRVLPVRTNC